MKIVITGGSGFLGSRIADYYRHKYEILTPSHSEMDITDQQSVKLYLKAHHPDIIIHCAAVSNVGICDNEPERTRLINVTGSENIAEACKNIGAKCIMCSSDQVYFGSTLKTPHLEDEELMPYNEYGRQKLTMEQNCLQKNSDCVMLRLSWMYDTKRKSEQEHDTFMRKLIADIQAKNAISFPIYDMRGITDVTEVVKNLEKTFHLPGGIYNFGSSNDKNTYETLCEAFKQLPHADSSLLHANTAAFADNHRNICMNIDKITNAGILFPTTCESIVKILKQI